jgi:hypothetical protein
MAVVLRGYDVKPADLDQEPAETREVLGETFPIIRDLGMLGDELLVEVHGAAVGRLGLRQAMAVRQEVAEITEDLSQIPSVRGYRGSESNHLLEVGNRPAISVLCVRRYRE